MHILHTASSISSALELITQPAVGGVVIPSQLCTPETSNQQQELWQVARHVRAYVVVRYHSFGLPKLADQTEEKREWNTIGSSTTEGATDLHQLVEQLLPVWNASTNIVIALPYSESALSVAQYARKRGLALHVTQVTSIKETVSGLNAGASGIWIPLKTLDNTLEHGGDELLSRVRSLADQSSLPTVVGADEVYDNEHMAYASEYGADILVMP